MKQVVGKVQVPTSSLQLLSKMKITLAENTLLHWCWYVELTWSHTQLKYQNTERDIKWSSTALECTSHCCITYTNSPATLRTRSTPHSMDQRVTVGSFRATGKQGCHVQNPLINWCLTTYKLLQQNFREPVTIASSSVSMHTPWSKKTNLEK